jgi:hypothetical protein
VVAAAIAAVDAAIAGASPGVEGAPHRRALHHDARKGAHDSAHIRPLVDEHVRPWALLAAATGARWYC